MRRMSTALACDPREAATKRNAAQTTETSTTVVYIGVEREKERERERERDPAMADISRIDAERRLVARIN